MPEISYSGSFNANTLSVPDLYINVFTAGGGVIKPASYGLEAIEGVASWGPVNQAFTIGSPAQQALYGNPVVRGHDLATALTVVLQAQQAAGIGANIVANRVTDGTDVAASVHVASASGDTETATVGGTLTVGDGLQLTFTSGSIVGSPVTVTYTTKTGDTTTTMAAGLAAAVNANTALSNAGVTATSSAAIVTVTYPASDSITFSKNVTGGATETITLAAGSGTTLYGMTLTSLYTGSGANADTYTIAPGSNSTVATPTWRLTLQHVGFPAEIFDNLGAGLTGIALWQALASAVNNGSSPIRGPSQYFLASAGTAGSTMVAANGTLAGGTDGANPTSAQLIGNDTSGARTGIYVFRASGASDLVVMDMDDETQEASQIAFGQSEGIYVHVSGPPGETCAAAVTAKQTAGSYNAWLKRYLGDWCLWQDNYNGVQRLLCPAIFGAALLSTLQPQFSGTNKAVYGVVATQRSTSGYGPYGDDELEELEGAGIDVICNPIPGGSIFGLRLGLNASANGVTLNDAWPRLTSFLARSLAGPGALGTLIGQLITPTFYTTGYAMLDAFLEPMTTGINGNLPMINAYQITFNAASNPQAQTTGTVIAQVLIQFLQEARVFLVNMTTGATVVIPANSNIPQAVQNLANAA